MKNPKQIEVVREGATYIIPTYEIINNGVKDSTPFELKFCKGSKDDDDMFRQSGFFTESLLSVCKHYLESVNVGDMKTEYTTEAIKNIQLALMWLNQRTQDRIDRQVQNTYKS